MTPQDDAPFGVFRLSYTILTWTGVAVMAVILVWVMWTLFVNTSAGTTRSQALAEVRPTQTALATLYGGGTPGAVTTKVPDICVSCHVIAGKGNAVCPNLNQIGAVAERRIQDPSYTGTAKTAEEYIRESITNPSAYCVPNEPGKVYCAGPSSIMPVDAAKQVEDLDALVTFLASQGK